METIEWGGLWWSRNPYGYIYWFDVGSQQWIPWQPGSPQVPPPHFLAAPPVPPPPTMPTSYPAPYQTAPASFTTTPTPKPTNRAAWLLGTVAVLVLLSFLGSLVVPNAQPTSQNGIPSPTAASTTVVPTGPPPSVDPYAAVAVTRVIDGDTIEVFLAGHHEKVRLIGVDTPETVDPSEPIGCYGKQASRFTTNILEGETVSLELDVEERDRYGRLLAYVYLGNEMFNEKLLKDGYGQVATFPPNVEYVNRFLNAQRYARRQELGLWGLVCNPPQPKAEEPPPPPEEPAGNCDPAYPDVCIPPPPPDLDCDDVSYSAFRVTEYPDPHGFDGDGDGVGCE